MANNKKNNKGKRIKFDTIIHPDSITPVISLSGTKKMAYGGKKKKYEDGGTYYAPGMQTSREQNVDIEGVAQDMLAPTVGDQTTDVIKETVTSIPGGIGTAASGFKALEDIGTGIAESTGDTKTSQNYNKRVSEGLFDPFTSQVNMLSDDDISAMDKTGAILLGGFGFSGHLLGKAENQRYADEVRKQMQENVRNNFNAAPEGHFNYGGPMGTGDDNSMQPNGENLDYNEYNGNTHANGGIPVGPKAEVEDGEVRVNDYIFSDQLYNPLTGKTFAEEAKKVKKKYSGRENDGPSNKAMEKELSKIMAANEMARQVVESQKSTTQEEAEAQLSQDLVGQGAIPGNVNPEDVDPAMLAVDQVGQIDPETGLEEPMQFAKGGKFDEKDLLNSIKNIHNIKYYKDAKSAGKVGQELVPGTPEYNAERVSYYKQFGLNADDYQDDLKFYRGIGGADYQVFGSNAKRVTPQQANILMQAKQPAPQPPSKPAYSQPNTITQPKIESTWVKDPVTGTYREQQRMNLQEADYEVIPQTGSTKQYNYGGEIEALSEKDRRKLERKNKPGLTLTPEKYGTQNWFSDEEDTLGVNFASLPLGEAIKKAKNVNKMIREKGLDYQKIKALSYYNRPQRKVEFQYGGPLTGLTDEELLELSSNMPTRTPGITTDPRINAPEDNTYTRNLSPEDYADMMQESNSNNIVDPVRMSMPSFEKPQGQLITPTDAELAAQKDSYLKASGYKNFNPEEVEADGKNFNMQDFGALVAANAAGIDNIIKSFRPAKTTTPRVSLDEVSLAESRLDMARQAAIQGKIHAGNVRSVAGSSGSALSNLSSGQAANAENLITNFLRSYQTENQQNAAIKNQKQMYNVQAEERERIANEQNTAAAMTARNVGLANIGTNYGMYSRDQKAEAENQSYNEMSFKLINQLYPNYSMMSPEERQAANVDIQKILNRGQFYYTPPAK